MGVMLEIERCRSPWDLGREPPFEAENWGDLGIFQALDLLYEITARCSGGTTKGEKSYAQFKPCFRTGV